MRRRLVLVAVIVTAVLAVVGTVVLISFNRRDGTGQSVSPPGNSAPGSSSKEPPGTAGGEPSRFATSPNATSPTAARGVPAALRGRDIEVIPGSQPVVALTFDAGANADAVPSILATLSARGIRATFFLTGNFAAEFPAATRAVTAAGHRIGNHTATHPHPLTLSDAALSNQLGVAENQLRAAGGGDPRPFFRFPFGERNAHTIAVVNAAGYVAVRWTVDSLGWQGLNGRTQQAATRFVTDRVLAAARSGAIVLMHVGSHPEDHTTLDAMALPAVVDGLRAQGYRFVTLDALLS